MAAGVHGPKVGLPVAASGQVAVAGSGMRSFTNLQRPDEKASLSSHFSTAIWRTQTFKGRWIARSRLTSTSQLFGPGRCHVDHGRAFPHSFTLLLLHTTPLFVLVYHYYQTSLKSQSQPRSLQVLVIH